MSRKLFLTLLVSLSMFASDVPSRAAELNLERYFKGQTTATGSFSAINGVKRKFTVALTGLWKNQTLTLIEDFHFDDGTRERKTWRFKKISPDTYRGTREDVVGETLVTVEGNMARFTYLIDVSENNRVRFHDTMILRPDNTLINRAVVTKYGFPVALSKVEFKRNQ